MVKLLIALLSEKFGSDKAHIKHYTEILKHLSSYLEEFAVEEGEKQFQNRQNPSFTVKDRSQMTLESRDYTYSVTWDYPSEVLHPVWVPDTKTLAEKIASVLEDELDTDVIGQRVRARDLVASIQAILSPALVKDLLVYLSKKLHRDAFEYNRIKLEPEIVDREALNISVDYDEELYNELPRDYEMILSLIPRRYAVGKTGGKMSLLEVCEGTAEMRWMRGR